MSEPQLVFMVLAAAVALSVPLVLLLRRRSSAIAEMLRRVAVAAGWSDITDLKLRHGVRGTWRSFEVSLAYIARQKSIPQRLIIGIRARTDVQLIVKRRFSGFFANKPLAWFGPPLVEVHAPAAAEFWVRASEVNVAERVFADTAVAAAVAAAIAARFDELRVDAKGLRIVRAVDPTPAREKYRFPIALVRTDPALLEPLAREEWNAAEAVTNKLSMM